jgi:hypothetical protein
MACIFYHGMLWKNLQSMTKKYIVVFKKNVLHDDVPCQSMSIFLNHKLPSATCHYPKQLKNISLNIS